MPPRARRANKQKPPDFLSEEKRTGDEKENIRSDKLLKGKRNCPSSNKLKCEEIKTEEIGKALLSPQKQKLELKTAGFWGKKLQDLEPQKGDSSDEKYSLYEFNGTDETRSYQKTKKTKRKAGASTKRKVAVKKCNKLEPLYQKLVKKIKKKTESEKKIKQIHQLSLFREKIMLSKEREQLADRGKKFTFSTGMPSLGITSTPAVNRDNLIGASNFLFLSPIIKEEDEHGSTKNIDTPLKSKTVKDPDPIVNPHEQTPKAETELRKISYGRVLRNGKVLST